MSYYSMFMWCKGGDEFLPFRLESVLVTVDAYNQMYETPLRCTELIRMAHLGSPATVHKCFKELIGMGLLEQLAQDDRRIKLITVSEKGHKYLKSLEILLERCKNTKKS